jgi:hypothetical protein
LLTVERIDDLPLLLAQMARMGIRQLLDRPLPTHGHGLGLRPGGTATLWLAPRLAAGDQRLNPVEPWARAHWTPRRPCPGPSVDRLALTEDRLAAVLRALADDDVCRGTASTAPVAGLHHRVCSRPSRFR